MIQIDLNTFCKTLFISSVLIGYFIGLLMGKYWRKNG